MVAASTSRWEIGSAPTRLSPGCASSSTRRNRPRAMTRRPGPCWRRGRGGWSPRYWGGGGGEEGGAGRGDTGGGPTRAPGPRGARGGPEGPGQAGSDRGDRGGAGRGAGQALTGAPAGEGQEPHGPARADEGGVRGR